MEQLTFGIIGSGNVASHLAPALVRGGARCVVVHSRTFSHATHLAQLVQAEGTDDLAHFYERCQAVDLVLLCVRDDALPDVLPPDPRTLKATVLHTSGSTPMSLLETCRSYGVLYPMQTFTRGRTLEVGQVPLFVEYNSTKAQQVIAKVAKCLGTESLQTLDSVGRIRLHLGAVFGCNFVNHLYAQAADCLERSGLPFALLEPLLRETLDKALSAPPRTVQTGPAVRRDHLTMNRHGALLDAEAPEQATLYRILSESIYEQNSRRPDEDTSRPF